MIPNALFAVLFFNVFLVASAVASPMVRDALQPAVSQRLRVLCNAFKSPLTKMIMTQTQ